MCAREKKIKLESVIELKLEKTKLSQLEEELELVLQEHYYKTVCKKIMIFLNERNLIILI